MPFGIKDVGGLNYLPLRPIHNSSKNPLRKACGEFCACMDGCRAVDLSCRSDSHISFAPACSMPSSKLNVAERKFTPKYLTGCQLRESHSHCESLGSRVLLHSKLGGSTLVIAHGKKLHHPLGD